MIRGVFFGLVLIAACDRGATTPPNREPVVAEPPAADAPVAPPSRAAPQDLSQGLLVVGWDAVLRSELETRVSGGRAILLAEADGQIRLLQGCSDPEDDRLNGAVYTFRGAPLREEHTTVDGATLDATYVGVLDVSRLPRDVSRLLGDCAGATHVVRKIDIGAFVLSSSSKRETKVEAPLAGGGVVGRTTSSSSSAESKSGDRAACAATNPPPSACRAAIRLHLQPLAR